uniref:Intraflagellar transport protein 81 homolog n=1 Tax=Syphacia muris TaxID=451379 RepID=A0A0N5AZJ5_9BILA
MTAETLKIIVQGLNDEPFNMKLNVIHFNALSSGKLLQILSDVLRWIESAPRIKIVQESAEDTALRIFDTLRVLRYKPPVDLDQEWRRGIVEGEKFAVYPILEWIFNNSDKLKERIYLAKYLTKIDVPGEYHDVETAELSNQITALMEEFKETETRKDTILVEDIKSDLKAMEQEKEYLLKKVEKTEDKLKNIPNAPKLLEFANILRLEKQREDVLMLQIQEQRNLQGNTLSQLQEELETNRYIVKEKLPKEIESKRAIIAELSKIANMPAIDEKSIADIQILAMAKKVTAISRKKAALAEKLQKNRFLLKIFRIQLQFKMLLK